MKASTIFSAYRKAKASAFQVTAAFLAMEEKASPQAIAYERRRRRQAKRFEDRLIGLLAQYDRRIVAGQVPALELDPNFPIPVRTCPSCQHTAAPLVTSRPVLFEYPGNLASCVNCNQSLAEVFWK